MLETRVVLDVVLEAIAAPLRCTAYPPSDLTMKIGEFDIVCPLNNMWPWWTVAVYHSATLMENRHRYSGRADEHGLVWGYEENDEPIGDDDPKHG